MHLLMGPWGGPTFAIFHHPDTKEILHSIIDGEYFLESYDGHDGFSGPTCPHWPASEGLNPGL